MINRDRKYEAQLVTLIKESFTADELWDELYFTLSITYDDIEGSTRSAKARGLVQYCGRNGRLPELVGICRTARPLIDWPSPPGAAQTEQTAATSSVSLKAAPNIIWVLLGAAFVGLIWGGSVWLFGNNAPSLLAAQTPTATATEIIIIVSDTPSPSPSATATATPTATATATPSPTPTATATVTPSPTPTATATATPSPTPTRDPYQPPNNPALGDSWRRPTDEMQMFFVPSATFWMGSRINTPNANTDEYPQHEVALTAFWMDYTEVTTTQFSLFLNEAGNQKEHGIPWIDLENSNAPIANDAGEFFPKPGMDDKPVTLMSWYGAEAYCQWAGGQLPTEAQWEFAARGTNSSSYPWGSLPPTCSLAQFRVCPNGVQAVGSKSPGGNSWIGAADMGGNVWEWTADWYGLYETAVFVNPPGPNNGSEKVLRGGSWGSDSRMTRAAYRNHSIPTYRSVFYGFRCSTPYLQYGPENGSE